MERLRFLVFEHEAHEHPGNMRDIARERGVDLEVVDFSNKLFSFYNLPEIWPFQSFDALIIMGGSMGAKREDPPFRSKTMELRTIQHATGNIPIFGVCLGAEEIALAYGGRVFVNKIEEKITKEIGFYRVDLTDDGMHDPLYRGLNNPLFVLEWHGDAFSLPEGAMRLSTTSLCENQSFIIRNRERLVAYGQLFHLEVTADMMPVWIEKNKEWIHEGFKSNDEELVEYAETFERELREGNTIVFGNFIEEARKQARARGKYV